MNPLWLLLIVPGAVLAGMVIIGLLIKLDDYEISKAELLDRQYRELRAEGENYEPSVNAWAEMIARHRQERAELEK